MDAEKELRVSREQLWDCVKGIFNETKVLDGREWNAYAGIAKYLSRPLPPPGVNDLPRAQRLGVMVRYAMALPVDPSAKANSAGEIARFDYPKTVRESKTWPVRPLQPCFLAKRRADLVWDDADEFAACGFPYTEVATTLGLDVRHKVYSVPLGQIKPPAGDVAARTGFFDNGSQFIATAATKATYDLAVDEKPYYAKWIVPKPTHIKDRQFHFDLLSDRYLRLNFLPFELKKGTVHLFLTIPGAFAMMKLSRVRSRLAYDALLVENLPVVGDTFRSLNERLTTLRAKDKKIKGQVWFVYAVEGAKETTSFKDPVEIAPHHSLHVLEQVVDPQAVVQSARGVALTTIDADQKNWKHRDWLKEMVRLRFSEPWVWFRNNAYLQKFYQIDREALFLKELKDEEKKAVGPLKDKLREFIKEAEADRETFLVRRGTKYGPDKRVIGSDDAYIYFYNNDKRLVTRLPQASFWEHVTTSQLATEIYRNTRGMIPICKAIVWGGLAVMGWGIVGTQVLVQGGRQLVQKKIQDIALHKLLKEQFDALKKRLFLLLLVPAMELLRLLPTTGVASADKVSGFLKGFVEGFVENSFESIFDRWSSVFNLEPASIRALKMIMKIEGILRWVEEKMSALKEFVSNTVSDALKVQFISVAVKIVTGVMALLHNLYFLEYERVKELLAVYAQISGDEPMTREQWDKLRRKHLLETFRNYEKVIVTEARDLKDLFDTVHAGVKFLMVAVRLATTAVVADVALGGGLVAVLLAVVKAPGKGVMKVARSKKTKIAAAGFAFAAAAHEDTRKEIADFCTDIGSALDTLATPLKFAWGTVQRMERLGQIVGIIIGSIVVGRMVAKHHKGFKQRWATKKSHPKFVAKHFLMSQFQINPLLPVIKLAMFHYTYLIEKVVSSAKDDFAKLEERFEEILLGPVDTRDIIEPDEGLSLAKLIEIVKVVETILGEWVKKLAEVPGLREQLLETANKLATIGPTELPKFDDLREGKGGWVREVFIFVALTQLHAALRYIGESLEEMLVPVNPKDANKVSVAFVLETLGFNLNESDALEMLDKNFDDVFKESAA